MGLDGAAIVVTLVVFAFFLEEDFTFTLWLLAFCGMVPVA
jgi:hypothetical protein